MARARLKRPLSGRMAGGAAELWRSSDGAGCANLRLRAPPILPWPLNADFQPTLAFGVEFDLVINLTTAKALGITILEPFLLRADAVIE